MHYFQSVYSLHMYHNSYICLHGKPKMEIQCFNLNFTGLHLLSSTICNCKLFNEYYILPRSIRITMVLFGSKFNGSNIRSSVDRPHSDLIFTCLQDSFVVFLKAVYRTKPSTPDFPGAEAFLELFS
jgi:hypothetical protein